MKNDQTTVKIGYSTSSGNTSNNTPQGPMCICFCKHPYETMHHAYVKHYAYIIHYAYIMHYALIMHHVINILRKGRINYFT